VISVSQYRWAWTLVWGGLATLGLCVGVAIWTPMTVVVLFVLAAAVAALVTVGHVTDSRSREPARDLTGLVISSSATAGLTVTAIAALAASAPSLLWPVLLLAGGTHPWLVGRALRLLRPSRSAVTAVGGLAGDSIAAAVDGVAGPWASELSDRDLCQAWTKSYDSLRAVTDPALRAGIVTLRQAFLDELERRNPSALSAWLASDASASSSPGRHLAGPQGEDR
jgi:hypothetical protein